MLWSPCRSARLRPLVDDCSMRAHLCVGATPYHICLTDTIPWLGLGRQTYSPERPRPTGPCLGDLLHNIPRHRTVKEVFENRTAELQSLIMPSDVDGTPVDKLSILPSNIHCAAKRRQAGALFVSPTQGIKPMAVWRNAAITWGMLPDRAWDRSSAHVTARTPWPLVSICPCCRTTPSNRSGHALSGRRLVTPSTTAER